MKEELKKVFTDIMEYQMNYVQLARTTKPYKLAERGLELLAECEVNKLNKAHISGQVCPKCNVVMEGATYKGYKMCHICREWQTVL